MSRTRIQDSAPRTFASLVALSERLRASLGPVLYHLVCLRASQINGCAFCVNMHATALERERIPSRTIYGVAAWRDHQAFVDDERAALEVTEQLTGGVDRVSDELWDRLGGLLGEERRADLLVAIGVINTWNMSMVSTRMPPSD